MTRQTDVSHPCGAARACTFVDRPTDALRHGMHPNKPCDVSIAIYNIKFSIIPMSERIHPTDRPTGVNGQNGEKSKNQKQRRTHTYSTRCTNITLPTDPSHRRRWMDGTPLLSPLVATSTPLPLSLTRKTDPTNIRAKDAQTSHTTNADVQTPLAAAPPATQWRIHHVTHAMNQNSRWLPTAGGWVPLSQLSDVEGCKGRRPHLVRMVSVYLAASVFVVSLVMA